MPTIGYFVSLGPFQNSPCAPGFRPHIFHRENKVCFSHTKEQNLNRMTALINPHLFLQRCFLHVAFSKSVLDGIFLHFSILPSNSFLDASLLNSHPTFFNTCLCTVSEEKQVSSLRMTVEFSAQSY